MTIATETKELGGLENNSDALRRSSNPCSVELLQEIHQKTDRVVHRLKNPYE